MQNFEEIRAIIDYLYWTNMDYSIIVNYIINIIIIMSAYFWFYILLIKIKLLIVAVVEGYNGKN